VRNVGAKEWSSSGSDINQQHQEMKGNKQQANEMLLNVMLLKVSCLKNFLWYFHDPALPGIRLITKQTEKGMSIA